MKTLVLAVSVAVALSIAPAGQAPDVAEHAPAWPHLQLAENCPKSGEVVLGSKKVCYYTCGATTLVKEVGGTDLCLGSMGG